MKTILGTMRKRGKVPNTEVLMKHKPLFSSEILSSPSKCLLTVDKARKKKLVYVLSIVHQSVAVDETQREIARNCKLLQKKVGVDVLVQMARYYTIKTATRRWPVAIFCNILDCICINAYIMFCKVTKTQISRRDFLLALIKEMCKPKVHTVGLSEHTSEASQQQISNTFRKTQTVSVFCI